ncbi:MAG TPA: histone deacetylase, partial [Thermoanaerobaculia bacterium]|nr:histone deacetylase [Thermoanaerobaculia bacterium]
LFNNVAIAARALQQDGVDRTLILDWDVHHGNGTQHLFEDRADVFYISTHRYPFYPGTGASSEIGSGTGRGFTRNFPFEAGAGDADYLRIFERQIIPLVEEYAPHAILISAGFDAHLRDPLGGMRLTESAFGAMTRRVCELADRFTGGRVFSILEGGYDPEGIAASVAEHVAALVE